MTNGYGEQDKYGTYGEGDLSPYELLARLQSFNKAIYLRIENSDAQLRTELSILDGEIRQNVLDVKQGLETTISTTASGIRTLISDTKNGLENSITQTAAGLDVKITNVDDKLNTQIVVTAAGLASKVSSTDYNGNTIASLISQSPSAINLVAQSIGLSGYVTFTSLTAGGTTNIDGARITTGLISADRIQADVVLAKLIQAGGISADQITSGTISANRLSANAISTTLLNAGGINANLITAGTISGDMIYGGTIMGAIFAAGTINVSTNANFGGYITLNAYNSGINFGNYSTISDDGGTLRITGGSGISITSPLGVYVEGYAQTRTNGLGFGYSSNNGRLYVSINGSDVGFVTLT